MNASESIQIPPGVATSSSNFQPQGCSQGSEETKSILQMPKQALVNAKSVSTPRYIHSRSSPDGGNTYYKPPQKVQPLTALLRQGLELSPAHTCFLHEEGVPRAGARVTQYF